MKTARDETVYDNMVLVRLLIAIEKMGYTHRGYGVRIAEATGFSRKDVSFILSGQKRLTYRFLAKFFEAFGVSEAWLKQGEGDIFTEGFPDLNPGKRDQSLRQRPDPS